MVHFLSVHDGGAQIEYLRKKNPFLHTVNAYYFEKNKDIANMDPGRIDVRSDRIIY